ncbi:hypothetical protein [Streptomyces halobius]|uniref:Uncharacterized protein n=1 Tax=Streptomyces halobius TaxID=2879846 RepID=A0ABY4MD36_9ACTN|nr:hypothetical protein [Streptomyces halobius]UQA95689.1 hypothetical protein K9S39_30915 [Streptomyces halobius]
MSATRQWPTRAEWQASAEYAVRTRCPAVDRLPADAVFHTPEEAAEARMLARAAAGQARPALTAAITALRARLPDRPAAGRARVAWFLALDADREAVAEELAALESSRTRLARAAREEHLGAVLDELQRLLRSSAVTPPEALPASAARLQELADAATVRRDQAAEAALQEAIAAEVARRCTDEVWEKELERRARVEAGPLVVHHRV